MLEILDDLDRWQRDGEQIAVATLVRVQRSAPRRPGARLGVTRRGKMTGSVSGGCVENDVFERAVQVLDSGVPVLASYGIDDDMGMRVGLSCGGTIDVLIETFSECEAWRAARDAVAAERAAVLCVALSPAGLIGRKVAVFADGRAGVIDEDLDEEIIAAARERLYAGDGAVLVFPWRGGEASVFLEPMLPPRRLFIIGATHTAIALCRLAKPLGFRVTVVDPRGVYATRERFAEADELLLEAPGDVLKGASLDPACAVVVLTHDAKFDIPSLAGALRSDAGYIGALGSRATHAKRQSQLEEQGFGGDELARIHAPIGLDIGARTPEEIALAIVAEIVAVSRGRQGRTVRDRNAPGSAAG
jgi:xanthine dehydrogenase accessory factor